ncbi:MAG: fasciclin domain-containing protein [Prolixibacteraceae bacterium]
MNKMKIFRNMNQIIHKKMTTRKNTIWFLGIISLVLTMGACNSDDVGDNYYTFTGETMGEYIENRPETYSEFTKMLDTTEVMGLLKAYGKYSCFVPTNEAIFNYYEKRGKNSMEDFALDSIKKMVYNHIIKDYILDTDMFFDGFLPNLTMSGRYLKVSFEPSSTGVVYILNGSSAILTKDILVHNGIVHAIDHMLAPTENTIVEAIAADKQFSLFFSALAATGLHEELMLIDDPFYEPPANLLDRDGVVQGHGILTSVPKSKKYGYTVLMESDQTYQNNGITTLDDLAAFAKSIYDQVYPQDAGITDVKDRKNSLNRFVAYHLIDKKIPSKLFIETWDNTGMNFETTGETHSIKSVDMFEYIETMCPNTLIEVRTIRTSNEYNVFNMTSGSAGIRLTANYDNDAINGVYHELDNILYYSRDVERMLTSKRLRMDAASFFPELMNNNMRIGGSKIENPSIEWDFPDGYIKRVKTSETTVFGYISSDDRFLDYQGDEVFLTGMYDFTITTLPIPAGTYEIRFGWQPTGGRGAAQLYWDGKPCGIPLDLRIDALDPKIGYVRPGTDTADPEGFENDKMMRNRGYMKGPASFKVINEAWYVGTGRMSERALRKILGIFTFDEAGTHEFSVKAARSGQFMFDYLEFVPVEVLETEDIY